ncbi:HEPN-associated N-terminal domain-containing protein [Rhizobium sp. GR12]|uniref:HEPN-associated N-terminal domain-containing protein n=1 Tax=Rhizobium sp. GR12 TaxID=3053925 RepID=UPI003FA6B12A
MTYRGAYPGFVCGKCFGNQGLIGYCLWYAQRRKCDFCRVTAKEPVAAPLGDVLAHVRSCVFQHYDDPANAGLSYESAEGGYQGATYDTEDCWFPRRTEPAQFRVETNSKGPRCAVEDHSRGQRPGVPSHLRGNDRADARKNSDVPREWN